MSKHWTDTECIRHNGVGPGYCCARINGVTSSAHVKAYTEHYGCVPNGLIVMHMCNNMQCINPEHLKLGTQSDNIKHSVESGTHFNANKTHCKYGHEFTADNTYYDGGARKCKQCRIRKNKQRVRLSSAAKQIVTNNT